METQNENVVAEDIADDLLYRTGLAVNYGQYDDIEDCFFLPQSLETLEGARIVRTPDDVRRVFDSVRAYFAEIGVVDVVRTIVEAKFISAREIESIHVSSLMTRDKTVSRPPYPVFNLIRRCDKGVWRITHSSYAITNSRDLNSALLAWRPKTTPKEPQNR
jgi:hypothetical protein